MTPTASLQVQKPPMELPANVQPRPGELEGGHTHAHVGFPAQAPGSAMQLRDWPPPGTPGR